MPRHTSTIPPAPGGAMAPWDDGRLYRRVLPGDYRVLPTPRPVTGTVVVEASPWVEDNQGLLDLAAREPFLVGLVGNLPVGTPEFAGHLRRLAAHPRFCGLRLCDRNVAGV